MRSVPLPEEGSYPFHGLASNLFDKFREIGVVVGGVRPGVSAHHLNEGARAFSEEAVELFQMAVDFGDRADHQFKLTI